MGWARSRQHCDPRLRIFKDYEIVVWRTKNIFSNKNISTDENLSTLYHEEWVFNFCAGEKLCVLSFGIKSLNLSFSNCIHSLSPAQQQMKINNYDSVFFLSAVLAGFNQHFKSNSRKLCGNDHAGLVILSERICSTAVCYPGPHCSVSDPGSDPCYWCKTLTQGARGGRGHRRQTLGPCWCQKH